MIFSPIVVDFLKGPLAHRRLHGGGRKQLIARAVGLKPKFFPIVLDLAAGLGRDAFVLATLGCDVTMLERHPAIIALLQDALNRANTADWFRALKLKLIVADAKNYLKEIKILPDIIYFDPMYPIRSKSALSKKEMRFLREVVGADEDAPEVLAVALKKALKRVVVKRPRLAPAIAGPEPDFVFKGKSSRFDVYLSRKR